MSSDDSLFSGLNVFPETVFTLQKDSTFGRHLVASKDLRPDDVILEEQPLSWAPMLDTTPICLTCVADVNGEYCCFRCGWPMCGSSCAKKLVHKDQVNI